MVSSQVVLNSSVPDGELNRLCPSQQIFFTCAVKGSSIITWRSDQYIGTGSASLQLSGTYSIGFNRTSSLYPSTVAILTGNRTEDGLQVVESELRLETVVDIFNFSVSCSHANETSKTINLQLLGKFNLPINNL